MRVTKMSATTALVQDDVDLQAVEAEVTTIFERYLQQDSEGRWSVNVEAVRQDGAPEAELQRIAEGGGVKWWKQRVVSGKLLVG